MSAAAIEVRGKHNSAKVFTDRVEQEALSQIVGLCDQEAFRESRIRVMPDVHAGAGCTIGLTMTIADKIVPNFVGVDIGCGMLTTELSEREIDCEALDAVIRAHVPSGRDIRPDAHPDAAELQLEQLRCADHADLVRAARSVGTLGGGNHFIEVGRGSGGALYLVIHSGSRNLGKQVAEHYQREAHRRLGAVSHAERESVIEKLLREGRAGDIQRRLGELKAGKATGIPREMAYAEGALFDDYIHDMRIVQQFAVRNRAAIARTILKHMGIGEVSAFSTIHNYIDTDAMILRKGAVSARDGEMLLVPINMRDGSLLLRGKGNPDWNFSAPHGAGRLMSRSKAKRAFSVDQYERAMRGIFTTSVGQSTLDECPMAYKPIEAILDNIADTAEVVDRLRPIYNFKAGE